MKKIALVGSPNVGKSVIFHCLTGNYATVSNYPGTTVEVTAGSARIGGLNATVIDTPGIYSVYPITEDERVTLDIISGATKPDLIVNIIDAKNLARMLPLAFQLKESGIPIVIALNMFDEAVAKGINIDTGLLSELLGMPVVATVATLRRGINGFLDAIQRSLSTSSGKGSAAFSPYSDKKMKEWHKLAGEIAGRVMIRAKLRSGLTALDKMIISPLTGLPILAAVIYLLLYKFVGVFGAGTVVDWLESGFEGHVNPWLQHAAVTYISWSPLADLFAGEYGILTLGLRYAAAIILPIVSFYFLVFALLEDSGYLPRISFLLDRAFKKLGLSGKAIIPIVLGFGCVTMATMVTRTLPTRRERFIATLLLALCIPCAAQTGVIIGILSARPAVFLAWAAIIAAIFAIVGALSAMFVPGERPAFIMEMPPMRVPQFRNVLSKTFARVKWYFLEIVPLFALASVLIWAGRMTGALDYAVGMLSRPLSMMGLPAKAAPAFIFGFFRRDYGAAGLYDLNRAGLFTSGQLLVAAVVLTLFLPCITQLLITVKERGLRAGVGISVFVLLFSFSVGVLLNAAIDIIK